MMRWMSSARAPGICWSLAFGSAAWNSSRYMTKLKTSSSGIWIAKRRRL